MNIDNMAGQKRPRWRAGGSKRAGQKRPKWAVSLIGSFQKMLKNCRIRRILTRILLTFYLVLMSERGYHVDSFEQLNRNFSKEMAGQKRSHGSRKSKVWGGRARAYTCPQAMRARTGDAGDARGTTLLSKPLHP